MSPAQLPSNPAVRPPDVLLTLSGDGASCVVTAGQVTICNPICILRRYCGTRNQLQSHPHPASLLRNKKPSAIPSASCVVTAGQVTICIAIRMSITSGWLFPKHAVRFFSATQWRIFIEIGQHVVRSGLSSWMRKTCFQAAMSASMAIGCNPQTNRFFILFFTWSLEFDY